MTCLEHLDHVRAEQAEVESSALSFRPAVRAVERVTDAPDWRHEFADLLGWGPGSAVVSAGRTSGQAQSEAERLTMVERRLASVEAELDRWRRRERVWAWDEDLRRSREAAQERRRQRQAEDERAAAEHASRRQQSVSRWDPPGGITSSVPRDTTAHLAAKKTGCWSVMAYRYCHRCRTIIEARRWRAHWEHHHDQERERNGSSRDWRRLRAGVIARDGGRCQVCGATTGLEVHHVDGNWRNDRPSNLRTLCATCHDQAVPLL